MLDDAAARLLVAAPLRLHVATVLGTGPLASRSSAELVTAARRLGFADDGPAHRFGVTFEPRYPGATAGVEHRGGGMRLVLGCTALRDGDPVATVLTTLIPGHPPQAVAAPPEVAVPAHWSELGPETPAGGAVIRTHAEG